MPLYASHRLIPALALLAMALTSLCGCERITPVRTLPSWVRGIYIPMIRNQSFEPGLEEEATRNIQEAFIKDGRLDVVKKKDADLELIVEIQDWKALVSDTTGDEIVESMEYSVTATVKLFEPHNSQVPLADLGIVRAEYEFNTDVRSTSYVPEPDIRSILLNNLTTLIMYKTIEGFPAQLRDVPPGVSLPEVRQPGELRGRDIFQERPGQEKFQ